MTHRSDLFNHISLIQSATHCLYGKHAAIHHGNVYDGEEDITHPSHQNFLLQVVEGMGAYVSSGEHLKTDAYVVVYTKNKFGKTLNALCGTLCHLFKALSAADPAKQHCMEQKIDDPLWKFTFSGEVFYPIALAPCYPQNSSRFNNGSDSTSVVFLPRDAFRRRHREGQSALVERVKVKIREDHATHGQPYDLSISLGQHECYKIVKPLGLGDPMVRWWEEGISL